MTNGAARRAEARVTLSRPRLWSPDTPYLYKLHVYVKDQQGDVVDGYCRRIGIRSIEFRGKEGFWLNGRPYPWPLIGANRHQDFAVVGNALSNSLHWRDARKLRDAGLRVIRNAHYPQDPAFMDALRRVGAFRDRQYPGLAVLERRSGLCRAGLLRHPQHGAPRPQPPLGVALGARFSTRRGIRRISPRMSCGSCMRSIPIPTVMRVAMPRPAAPNTFPCSSPIRSTGDDGAFNTRELDPKVCYFTREWGDNVDDWNSHNSPSRVNRGWGEVPMLVQAKGYARPDYQYTCYDALWRTPRQHVGGCLCTRSTTSGAITRSLLRRHHGRLPAAEILLLHVLRCSGLCSPIRS